METFETSVMSFSGPTIHRDIEVAVEGLVGCLYLDTEEAVGLARWILKTYDIELQGI